MSSYLFVDAAYFHQAYSKAMQEFFGEVPTINFADFAGRFDNPSRVYYYDAVDRGQVGSETDEQRVTRVADQDRFHAYLNSVPRWHVREGFVSRGRRAKRRSQKGVDVQLAVDALEHAVAHNMHSAGFIFGDLDFEPLLFSLNRFGVSTKVWYETLTASDELLEAADERQPLNLYDFFVHSVTEFQAGKQCPNFHLNHRRPDGVVKRQGRWNGRKVLLVSVPSPNNSRHDIWIEPGANSRREASVSASIHDTPARVELAFRITYGGSIEWEP